jgi:hypothetical protein
MAHAFRSLGDLHLGDLVRVRSHAALARSLLDELERVVPASSYHGDTLLREQLAEELARLGCRLLECAAMVTETVPPSPTTGRA